MCSAVRFHVTSMLLFGGWATRAAGAAARRINVALHAQSNYEMHGWVAGSEVTTGGLKRAFDVLDRVQTCKVFAPFSYDGISSRKWDLVVVEGYIGSVPAFIHEIRAGNEEAVVLFFCLDTYPSLAAVGNLDVDAFLTNSRVLLPRLRRIAPASSLLHLAADPAVMRRAPPRPGYSRADHNVVYLGQFKNTKHRLLETLKEVAPLGLSVYGNGWHGVEDVQPFWRGVLPVGDIAALYSSAKVVISTTETLQRTLGMVNNRVFEALSCGAAVVADAFPAMEETFGDHVLYYRGPGDAARAAKFLLGNETAREELGRRGRELVLSRHTYASRVPSILATMENVLALRAQASARAGANVAAADVLPPEEAATERVPVCRGAAGDSAIVSAAAAFGAVSNRSAIAVAPAGTTGATPSTVPEQAADHCYLPDLAASAGVTNAAAGGGDGRHRTRIDSGLTPVSPPEPDPGRPSAPPVLVRPNSPTVLVVFRSDRRPSEGWRRGVESAAAAVPGGVRVDWMEVSDAATAVKDGDYDDGDGDDGGGDLDGVDDGGDGDDDDDGSVGFHAGGKEGPGDDEASRRRRVLESHLSRLLAGAGSEADREGPQAPGGGVVALGAAAAAEALRFMEWCCAIGMILVFAEVGDPLERHFLHHLAGEKNSRVVRTAFFAAHSPAEDAREYLRSLPTAAQRLERYEWVERYGEGDPSAEMAAVVSEQGLSPPGGDEVRRKSNLRLSGKIERVLFGISRHASIAILEPREGTLLAAKRGLTEDSDDWALLNLFVEVDHPFFRTPDDGLWCVLLDGVEVGCQGDGVGGDPAESISSLTMAVEVDPRAMPLRARVEAVARGGSLEAPAVVSRAPPVFVSLWVQ